MPKGRPKKLRVEEIAANITDVPVNQVDTATVNEVDIDEKQPVYVFDGRCPRCKTNDSDIVSTDGNIQNRICRRPVCRQEFTAQGELY
jgi:hypothetical protein